MRSKDDTLLTGAEYILKKIRLTGVKHIFGIPGAHIDPLYAAFTGADIEPIINCHELSAGYMADGYSRASNKLGVLIGIGGPGSNNMITAVNTTRVENTPLLIITGDVPVCFSDVPGFQNGNNIGTNDDAIFKIITKYSKRIKNVADLVLSMDEAIAKALTPPYGPAHLIVPFNVFNETTGAEPKPVDYNKLKYWKNESSEETVTRLKNIILSDKKIILWIGGTLNKKEEAKHIKEIAEQFYIPVATSYNTKGVIPEDHELALGNFGFAGSKLSKEIFFSDEPDVIVGFDIEQTERNSLNWNPDLYKNKELILINFPGSYTNCNYGETIKNNPLYILKSLNISLKGEKYETLNRKKWFENLLQNINSDVEYLHTPRNGNIEPYRLVQILREEMPADTILFTDSGNHRIFPGIHWVTKSPESFYSAATVAPMGWAIAAGIGCKFNRQEPVVIFTGDGCMQMHGIELKTAAKHNKAILVIILNNSAYGSIYMRYSKISEKTAKMAAITEIDWNLFSKSFGAEVFEVTSEIDYINHIHRFLSKQKLTILNVRTPVNSYIIDASLIKSAFI